MSKLQESRLEKLEEKVDLIKDDLVDLKYKFESHSVMMQDRMEVFGEHIEGDRKIINILIPVLEKLPTIVEMAEKYEYEKLRDIEIEKNKSNFKYYFGIVLGVIGALAGLVKIGVISF